MRASPFSAIWLVVWDVELRCGERVLPCTVSAADVVALNEAIVLDRAMMLARRRPPYPSGPDVLLVTIDAHLLAGCHLVLGWRLPDRIIDLLVEYRAASNGHRRIGGPGVIGACLWHGLPLAWVDSQQRDPVSSRRRLETVKRLFEAMTARLDLGRALLRGRYMVAVAKIEAAGVPIDTEALNRIRSEWPTLRLRLVAALDRHFGVFDGTQFRIDAFEAWLARHDVPWPRTNVGQLDLRDGTFRDMARAYPKVRPLKELRTLLAGFHPFSLAVGQDCRNRAPLRPFTSRTGRSEPSTKASVLAMGSCARHLIRAQPGMGLAMIDWSQQEFGVAAALSGDHAMQAAYTSGDAYMALAIVAGAAPLGATAASHGDVRQRYKTAALGIQYGMGTKSLAQVAGLTEAAAIALLRGHRAGFPGFWRWSDAIETEAHLTGSLTSVFGWRVAAAAGANPRFLRNFPVQANGAEMLRLACCLVTEDGIAVCATLHDALLVEAPIDKLQTVIARTQALMAEAARTVLDGFELRTDAKAVTYPDRHRDPRGATVWGALEQILGVSAVPITDAMGPVHRRDATCPPPSPRPISLYVSNRVTPDDPD